MKWRRIDREQIQQRRTETAHFAGQALPAAKFVRQRHHSLVNAAMIQREQRKAIFRVGVVQHVRHRRAQAMLDVGQIENRFSIQVRQACQPARRFGKHRGVRLGKAESLEQLLGGRRSSPPGHLCQ